MREYYDIALLGECTPSLQQAVYFLLASYRYNIHPVNTVESIPKSCKLILVMNDLSSAEYDLLYHQQSLPTLLWGMSQVPQPCPEHVQWTIKQIGGGLLIQLLDGLLQIERYAVSANNDVVTR